MSETLDEETIRRWVETCPAGARIEKTDSQAPGLMIRVGGRGAVWSILTRDRFGRKLRQPLGPWPRIDTEAARAQALRLRGAASVGALEAAAAIEVGAVLGRYQRDHLDSLKSGKSIYASLRSLLEPVWTWPSKRYWRLTCAGCWSRAG